MRAIPLQFLPVDARGHVAEKHGGGKWNGIVKVGVRLAPFADGFEEFKRMLHGLVRKSLGLDDFTSQVLREKPDCAVVAEPYLPLCSREKRTHVKERSLGKTVLALRLFNDWRQVLEFALAATCPMSPDLNGPRALP